MRRFAVVFLLVLSPTLRADLLDQLFAVRTFHKAAVSPDGKRVAWAVKNGGLHVRDLAGGAVTDLGSPKANIQKFAFSPDGKHIAWFAERKLYVDGRQLAAVSGSPDALRWSPDGKRIAFLLFESSREAGALVATARKIGVIEEQPEAQRVVVADVA